MTQTSSSKADKQSALYETWLHETSSLLEAAIQALLPRETLREIEASSGDWTNDPQLRIRAFAFWGLGDTIRRFADAVVLVAQHGDIGPGFVLARALAEQAVTFTYLCIAPKGELETWARHGQQKGFRLLDRSRQVGSVGIHVKKLGTPAMENIPGMKAAFDAFTGRTGRENTHWTSTSLDDQLAAVSRVPKLETAAQLLLVAVTLCYEIGAEVQHSSAVAAQVERLRYLGDDLSQRHLLMFSAVLCLTAATAGASVRLADNDLYSRVRERYLMFLSRATPGPENRATAECPDALGLWHLDLRDNQSPTAPR